MINAKRSAIPRLRPATNVGMLVCRAMTFPFLRSFFTTALNLAVRVMVAAKLLRM